MHCDFRLSISVAKRIKTSDAAGDVPSNGGTSSVDLNLPLSSGKACLVKVMDPSKSVIHVSMEVHFYIPSSSLVTAMQDRYLCEST